MIDEEIEELYKEYSELRLQIIALSQQAKPIREKIINKMIENNLEEYQSQYGNAAPRSHISYNLDEMEADGIDLDKYATKESKWWVTTTASKANLKEPLRTTRRPARHSKESKMKRRLDRLIKQ